jgi:prophage antirepressor-like protein
MRNLIPFDFNGQPVRVITVEVGELWFVAKDIAEILEYSDASKMTKKLDDDEKSNLQIAGLGSPSGNRGVNVINESGLWSSVLRSTKPEAKAFKKWITSEFLPSIRKTGSYLSKPMTQLELAKAQVALFEKLEQVDLFEELEQVEVVA